VFIVITTKVEEKDGKISILESYAVEILEAVLSILKAQQSNQAG